MARRAASVYSSNSSMPMTRRPSRIAARAVVPLPMKQSSIEGLASQASVENLRSDLEHLQPKVEDIEETLGKKPSQTDLVALEERLTRKMWRAAFASAGLPASLVAALLAVFRFLL